MAHAFALLIGLAYAALPAALFVGAVLASREA